MKLSILILFALLILPVTAFGQSAPEFPHSLTTPGFSLPGESMLFGQHPDAPASMVSLKGLRLGVTGMEYLEGAKHPWSISGESVFFVYPVPLLSFAVGGSVDMMRGPEWNAARINVAFGAAISRTLFWGMRYSQISAPTFAPINGAGSFSLSLRWQPHPYFGLTLQSESLFMEQAYEIPMDRIHRLGFLIGQHNQLWANIHLSERRGDYQAEAGVRFMPLKGLYIWGSGGYGSLNRDFYQTGTGVVEGDTPSSWYAGMGITVSLGRLAWALGARGPNPSMGWSLVWDEESVLKSIIPDPEYAIMLDFSKSWDEKYHFKLVTYATRCQADYNCRGVVIKASDGHVGWAWAGEWSRIITRLRASGRKVLVYGYSMSNSMYAIACAADRIILYPGGSISLKGLSMTKLYFAEGFSKLGVKAQFARFSQFKSAPEAFTNLSPSKEDMATMSSILKMVERQFRIMLLKRKGMGHKKIVDLFLKGSINPVEAIKLGLIDGMRYPDQMDMESARMLKTRVPLFDPSGIKQEATLPGTRGVAVLLLEGEIVIKSSMTNFLTGSSKQLVLKKVSKALSQAMGDPRIRAVVLRINSPGGSALASDVLWRTISKMNYAKPVIVSFGNYATSGGYYLGCPGRKILAESATITGSIGIFGGKFSVGDLLRKAGVGVTTIKRSPHADMSSIYRPYTDEEMLQLKSSLKYSYFRFLAAVAKGRSLPLNSMEKLAGGRLWTGEQAKKRKLVDGIGGLSEAIAMAKKMAKLSSKSPVYLVYPAPPSLLRQLITKNLGIPLPSTESKAALKPLGISVPASLLGPGPWARTPYTLTIK